MKILRNIPAEKIRLLIFDLDGTLVDSRLDLANSVNAMLHHYKRKELPADVIATYVGDGAPMLVRRALGDPDDEHFVHEALDFFIRYYREHKLDNTHVYPGVIESLRALSTTGNGNPRTMAILSNKPVNPTRQISQALGLAEFFVQIYGGNSFPTKKPDPQGVEALLWETNCDSEEAIIIGDSDVDILTARNAGIWSCGVTYGFAPHTLETAPPDVLVESPDEWVTMFSRTKANV
ncbi:MAG: HAD-IA family hydrolase [Acidobacteriales bacterium]|nr:HAD-IA family hydrolase [Terriglobales bacterium]